MKLKQSVIVTVAATVLVGLAPTNLVNAESIDSKIANEEQKISDLNKKKVSAENTLADLEKTISSLTAESDSLLNEKVKLEKEVNQLTLDIKDLEVKIEKRNAKIEEQARSTQINQDQQDIVNVLLDAESLSDAIGRTVAYTKLVSANNDIMQAQKDDQESLDKKKTSVETKVTEITKKATALEEKQTELEVSKTEQVQLANTILKNIDSAKDQKAEYVSQKEEAERIAAEQARIAAEAAAQQKAADEAAAAAQKVVEVEAQKQQDQLETEEPVSLSKGTGEKGTSDNSSSQPTYASGFQLPLTSFTVSSRFGNREDPTGSSGNFHAGIDLAAPGGTPIMAARAGNVVQSGFESGAGNYVIIQHDNGYYTYYMHMNAPGIAAGSTVSAGDVIGAVGTTGSSTGNHLHFGISTSVWGDYLDPAPFIGL